jgi:hypothetical protein
VNTAPVWSASPTLATLSLFPSAGATAVSISKTASGQVGAITGLTTGVLRWQLLMGDTAAETGANAGSNFTINAYTDAGAYLSTPFSINRASGDVSIVSGAVRAGPAIYLNKGASGQQSALFGQLGSVNRWTLALGDTASETGGNAGSNLSFYANSDAGAFLSTPLSLIRSDLTNPVQILAGGLYRQLTLGATDSGGAGFRMVRVSN